MPDPCHAHVALLLEKLADLIDELDLSDAEADTLCDVVLPKLQQASGLDVFAFRELAMAAVAASPSTRRH
jgi:hypothetical protein